MAEILFALESHKANPKKRTSDVDRAHRIIIGAIGKLYPSQVTTANAYDIEAAISNGGYAHSTMRNTAGATIRTLAWLNKYYGTPELAPMISKHPGLRPRNVTATEEEKELLLTAAPDYLRLFILLCSDLAIRSGTVAKLGPDNYDRKNGELRFTTKMAEKLTLPVTEEIADLIDQCDQEDKTSFVRQLHRNQLTREKSRYVLHSENYARTIRTAFSRLEEKVGITRKLTPHDFRRTTAVKLYEITHDVRDVQALLGHRSMASTIWYLDHDIRKVSLKNLEIIKRPNRMRKEVA